MKFIYALAILFSAAATTAFGADGPDVRMAEIPLDTIAIYDRDNGDPFTTIYKGHNGEGYVVEVRDGDEPGGSLSQTYLMDDKGQRIHLVTRDNEYTYKPNFCTRTLGSCRFKAHNRNTGQYFSMQRNIEQDGDRFVYKLYLNGRVAEQGWFQSGRFGMPIKYIGGNGNKGWVGTLREIIVPD